MLLVEVDGSQHLESGYDERRDANLLNEGYSILRVPSVTVLQARQTVCDSILAALEGRMEDIVEAPDLSFVSESRGPSKIPATQIVEGGARGFTISPAACTRPRPLPQEGGVKVTKEISIPLRSGLSGLRGRAGGTGFCPGSPGTRRWQILDRRWRVRRGRRWVRGNRGS